MLNKAIILGNGPSKRDFTGSKHYVMGCNIPGDYKVNATIIVDEEIAHIIGASPKIIQTPIIISKKAFSVLQSYKNIKSLIIEEVFDSMNLEWHNSAHFAAICLAGRGYEEVEIWGCDSVFKDHIESSTDSFVKKDDTKDARFYRNWRIVWNSIFKKFPNTKFTIIKPKE